MIHSNTRGPASADPRCAVCIRRVKLEPGEYVYSCPLNPTPNYHLVVSK